MKTKRTENKYEILVEIDPFNSDNKFHPLISVSKRKKIGNNEWRDAMINWSAIGEVESAMASDFGQTLIAAANMADALNIEKETKDEKLQRLKMHWCDSVRNWLGWEG